MKILTLLLGILISGISIAAQESLVVGAGCFWGVEKKFEQVPGVISVVSGYAGGDVDPTYKSITSVWNRFSDNNHAEVVKVTFDNSKVSTRHLLQVFWEMHDPTTANRQGNDVGTNYRSIVLFQNLEQKDIATATKREYAALLKKAKYKKTEIVTEIKPLDSFTAAENYHQDYLVRNPNGYCPDHSTGVRFPASNKVEGIVVQTKQQTSKEKIMPLRGKEIVVIDAEFNCPYCARFKKDVINNYKGSIPIRIVYKHQLKGFTLISDDLSATPTILFIHDGKELSRHRGYMKPKQFYHALGQLTLNSAAFDIAFNKGTEPSFCRDHALLREKRDGYFVDILSGAKLFDSRDKYDSRTGWPSWTRSLPGAVIEQADYSFGMVRTELVSASSGIHLGHKFNDGPGGKPRYCINGSVLRFVPRSNS